MVDGIPVTGPSIFRKRASNWMEIQECLFFFFQATCNVLLPKFDRGFPRGFRLAAFAARSEHDFFAFCMWSLLRRSQLINFFTGKSTINGAI